MFTLDAIALLPCFTFAMWASFSQAPRSGQKAAPTRQLNTQESGRAKGQVISTWIYLCSPNPRICIHH